MLAPMIDSSGDLSLPLEVIFIVEYFWFIR